MVSLWSANHPRYFWQCQPEPPEQVWQAAITAALPSLGLSLPEPDMETVLNLTLGEGRFGSDHWTLSLPKRVYYRLKPLLPRALTRLLRRAYRKPSETDGEAAWPIEPRYVSFLWQVLAHVLRQSPAHEVTIKSLWPDGQRFALVLTHDVEAKAGLDYVGKVADLEESLGFRSSFNFVPANYPVDMGLVAELRQRGFEVGVHGYKHDGRLFESRSAFEQSAIKINQTLQSIHATGFRAPLTIRNPEWMQALDIAYDLSFFDTDPFEPIPGGTMSIWPFFLGRFVELPYTLVQDYTLTDVLKEGTPRLWFEKVEYIRTHCGMALINTHPDYLRAPFRLHIYTEFLQAMQEIEECWKALPGEVADWWNNRSVSNSLSTVSHDETGICITSQGRTGRLMFYQVPIAMPAEEVPTPA